MNLSKTIRQAFTDAGFKTTELWDQNFEVIAEEDTDDGWTTRHRLGFHFNSNGTKIEKVLVREA